MTKRDLGKEMKLEDLKRRVEKERRRIASINQKIEEGVDFEEEGKLEARKNSIFEEISKLSEEIAELEIEIEQQHHHQPPDRANSLATIVQDTDDLTIQQAYRALRAHWHTEIPATMPRSDQRTDVQWVTDLERLGASQDGSYSGLESFIAHLWQSASAPLLNQLEQWGQNHYPNRNWAELHQAVQTQRLELAEGFQPAIFVKLSPAEERTVQTNNQPHYRLEAWLIEDIDTYKTKGKRRRGFEALITAETPEAEPFPIESLEEKIQALLGKWIRYTRAILMDCERDPEFYVFLPKELLETAVDQWPLTTRGCLGHTYSVVLCCLDRVDYPTASLGGWKQYWQRYENAAGEIARDVFIECNGSDILAVRAAIDTIEASDVAVGLYLTDAPSAETLDLIAEELWMVGLPLLFWGRCDSPAINNAQALDTILQIASLDELAETLKSKRYASRSNAPEYDIGYHLSLLSDNPRLIYPLSA
jgi:hypothetical protein